MRKRTIKKLALVTFVLTVLLYSAFLSAGTGTISNAVPGSTIFASDFNKITSALKGDLVPRNNSGIAQGTFGALGSSTYPWSNIYLGASASGLSIGETSGSMTFKVGGTTHATLTATGFNTASYQDGSVTYAKLNADALFKLKRITGITTVVIPANVTEVFIIGCGGGGGGGAGGPYSNPNFGGGGSGGNGGVFGISSQLVTPGETITISRGAGGTGASVGGSAGVGGNTTVKGSFGTVTFRGGLAGVNGAASTGGTTVPTIIGSGVSTAGGNGGNQNLVGSGGAAGFQGVGGSGGASFVTNSGGGGGGGGSGCGGGSPGNGGAGANGNIALPVIGGAGASSSGGGGGGGGGANNNYAAAGGGNGGSGDAWLSFTAP